MNMIIGNEVQVFDFPVIKLRVINLPNIIQY